MNIILILLTIYEIHCANVCCRSLLETTHSLDSSNRVLVRPSPPLLLRISTILGVGSNTLSEKNKVKP